MPFSPLKTATVVAEKLKVFYKYKKKHIWGFYSPQPAQRKSCTASHLNPVDRTFNMEQLRSTIGQEAVLTIRRYEKELQKLESLKNRITFLQDCLDNKILPKSFKSTENASGLPF